MSVFGYDNDGAANTIQDHDKQQYTNTKATHAFQHDWYYRLATWYREKHQVCTIDSGLPWNDVTVDLRAQYELTLLNQRKDGENVERCIAYHHEPIVNRHPTEQTISTGINTVMNKDMNTVVIVGAGMAGLTATLELANIAAAHNRPLKIILVEANSFVGGRTRTILTDNQNQNDGSNHEATAPASQYDVNSNDKLVQMCRPFHPWPVPIGAEFIHGVGSCLNDLIMDRRQNDIKNAGDWTVEETFDLCENDEYPSHDPFTNRGPPSLRSLTHQQREAGTVTIFGDGKQWTLSGAGHDLHNESDMGQRYPRLIRRSQSLWNELLAVNDILCGTGAQRGLLPHSDKRGCPSGIPQDMALSAFIEQKMVLEPKEDIDTVKNIMDSIFAKTAGTSIDMYGVNEASREEHDWDYTECNFRTKGCFADLVAFHIDRIHEINHLTKTGNGHVQIDLITDCPIDKVESLDMNSDRLTVKLSSSRTSTSFIADKAIISVPLAILKAEKIQFTDDFALPTDKRLAIEKTNMFSGMKAHILLRKKLDILEAVQDMECTELVFCPGEIFAQVWLRRDETSVFVTGFVVADGRDTLKRRTRSGESATFIFLDQLNRMFMDDVGRSAFINAEMPTCSAFALHDWSDDEYIMGTYSSPSIGAGWGQSNTDQFATEPTPTTHSDAAPTIAETCRHCLAKPIKNTIFFAGEHTNIKTCATVQAAMESGNRAAAEVAKSLLIP